MVEKIISKEQDTGVDEIKFNADGLAEGTYYYQLIAGNYLAKKMELSKKADIPPQHSNKEGGNCL